MGAAQLESDMWVLLKDDFSSSDPVAIAGLLDTLGLSEPTDIGHCDADDIAAIADLLKKVKRKKFMHLFAEFDLQRRLRKCQI